MWLQVTAKAGGLELDKLTVSTEITKKVNAQQFYMSTVLHKSNAYDIAGTGFAKNCIHLPSEGMPARVSLKYLEQVSHPTIGGRRRDSLTTPGGQS